MNIAEVEASIHDDELDGVRTVWADTGPPYWSSLMFKVGFQDEAFLSRGITHLAEHLALNIFEDEPFEHNGHVTIDVTVFHLNCSPDDLSRQWGRLSKAIASPPVDRLERERSVLAAEASTRNLDGLSRVLRCRYGYRGPGLVAAAEWGLRWAGAPTVEAWARSHFTKADAVLVVNGPLPNELRLDLPEGTPTPRPDATNLRSGPCSSVEGTGGVVVSFDVSRALMGNRVILQMLREDLLAGLRHGDGNVYDISIGYLPVTKDRAEATLTAICQDERSSQVAEAMVSGLARIARAGIRDELVTAVLQRNDPARSNLRDLIRGQLGARAWARAMGEDIIDSETLLSAVQRVTSDDVSRFVAQALQTMVVLTPKPARFEGVDVPLCGPVDQTDLAHGHAHSYAGPKADWPGPGSRLLHTEAAISLQPADGSPAITIHLNDLVASLQRNAYENLLVGAGASVISVWPANWSMADELVKFLNSAAPPELRLSIDEDPLIPRPLPVRLPADL